ncbi:CRAL-TRIO domain-containing protein C3H8.02 [Paramyrothecium foliicola]|nr:CRAL-TRIO domain-containing protein C3H8.02 [Paramyrothecium foliicola]
MAGQLLPGRPGNLTPEEEDKLRKLWQAIFNICGLGDESANAAVPAEAPSATENPSAAEPEKKKRFNVFRKKGPDAKSATPTPPTGTPPRDGGEDDKYGQTKQFYETLATQSPEDIRATVWAMIKHDHPDAVVLRFLRARKWDVEKALVMFVSTMNWRHTEMHLDDDIMKNGEAGAAVEEQSGDAKSKALAQDFLKQLRMGKNFLHGTDKQGRPICYVRVRLHRAADQSEASIEKSTVYTIETTRMLLTPPVDTATIVFDMTGFSMANMDYAPVKFMIQCFEANYPECLGAVLVHNAPWVFQGIWKIIRGWLDPVVAAKVHFTNNKTELEQFIESSQILKELGGENSWQYKYFEPIPGENDKMKDTETRDRLLKGREELVKKFEAATQEWIQIPDGDKGKEIKQKRHQLAGELRDDYWRLDPYVRARSLYDRQNVLQAGGHIDWSNAKLDPPPAGTGVETSADDVD